ncbi:MAG: hypothetical protein HeimC3_45430 [Candidatus Heimdallarchaeota archaeon LC_3]|nr:MAG: hypothetical protein HeimC3_45430 [Candidatus Heimdallarchaeota archaeon LC_3]
MVTPKFTIVAPIKDEVERLKRSLPYYYKTGADEVIICTDDPSPPLILEAVKKLAIKHGKLKDTKVLAVSRSLEFKYHQAWVRRLGFKTARNDIVMAADIDLYLNKNVLEAVKLVGKNNIGLVSLYKFKQPYNLETFLRTIGDFLLKITYIILLNKVPKGSGLYMSLFTGLYAMYRPYWENSEDEGIKRVHPPFHKASEKQRREINEIGLGEDTYLRDCMEKKHRVISLSKLGGVVMDREKQYHPKVQFDRGRYSARKGRSYLGAIVHTIAHIEPEYLKGFLHEKVMMKNVK